MRHTGGRLPDTVALASDKSGFAPTSYQAAPAVRDAVGPRSRLRWPRDPTAVCSRRVQWAAARPRSESPATTARNCVARSPCRLRSGKLVVGPRKIRKAARSRRCSGLTGGAQALRRRSLVGCSPHYRPTLGHATRRRAATRAPARWPAHGLSATPPCKLRGRPTSCAPGSTVFHGCRGGTSTIADK